MPVNALNTTARNIAYIVGTLLLALGVITLIHPQIMGRYGLIADTTHSIMSIRSLIGSLIGGSEIGMGGFIILGGKLSVSIRARLWFAMFLFGGIVLSRLVSIVISGATIPEMIMRELIAELVVIGLIFVGLKNANRR